jgi:hypothetical protein
MMIAKDNIAQGKSTPTERRCISFLSYAAGRRCISLVWQYLNQRLPRYFVRTAHILITIDIEPTTELACHSIFANKCLASDLHNGTKWEQRGTGYRIAPPTNVHS